MVPEQQKNQSDPTALQTPLLAHRGGNCPNRVVKATHSKLQWIRLACELTPTGRGETQSE